MSDTDQRAAYIEGLRQLATALENHDEIPLPYHGDLAAITFHFLNGDDPPAAMAAAARALPCTWRKDARDEYFDLYGSLAGLKIHLAAFREAVCTRRVVGVREVTEEVPDPAAPTITVTRTVEDVEWDCKPVLAHAAPAPQCLTCGATTDLEPVHVRAREGIAARTEHYCRDTAACHGRRHPELASLAGHDGTPAGAV